MASYSKLSLVVLSFMCVALSSNPRKPLWNDEFLHFAVGAYESTSEAWQVVRSSISQINHGQTGTYMMVDYWLLRIFGASPFWLRFPSLLAGVLLFMAALHLFEKWNLPFAWRLWGCLALFSQPWLMDFVAEARPYMVLAATTVATLAYYTTPLTERSRLSIRVLGSVGIVGGALFHPYFLVYWLFVCSFSYFHRVLQDRETLRWSVFIHHCDPLLSILGIMAYFVLGYLTWMPHLIHFNFDPFEYLKHPLKPFLQAHLAFLWTRLAKLLFLAVTGLTGIGLFLIPTLRQYRKLFLSPIMLLSVSFGISALLSYVAYRQNYWILQRQWVASVALAVAASTWFAYLFSTLLPRKFALIWSLVLFGLIGFSSFRIASEKISHFYAAQPNPTQTVRAAEPPFNLTPTTNEQWVLLANLNSASGGPVWPVFRLFYKGYQ